MPQLPYSIELHDSELSRIEQRGGSLHIFLSPAYIHCDGKGWSQDVEVIVSEATVEGEEVDLPAKLSDGRMKHHLVDVTIY